MKLGIVPAAGKAERWGGHIKELMPTGKGEAIIDFCMQALIPATDAILVVTSPEKLPVMAAHLAKHDHPIAYIMQSYVGDIWGAIRTAIDFRADTYLFAMPDTVLAPSTFAHYPTYPFAMGLFKTNFPERFGVIANRRIVNKKPLSFFEKDPPYEAWGVLKWDAECVDYWLYADPLTYTEAFNSAIGQFGLSFWQIPLYYDMATHNDYLAYFAAIDKGERPYT